MYIKNIFIIYIIIKKVDINMISQNSIVYGVKKLYYKKLYKV